MSPSKKIYGLDYLCEHYIKNLYLDTPTKILMTANNINNSYPNYCFSYGQIMYRSLKKILAHIQIRENDVIIELGSGIGKTAIQCLLRTPAKTVKGIEIDLAKNKFSQQIKHAIDKDLSLFLTKTNKELQFIHGDFFKVDFCDANIIFMDATCFSFKMIMNLRSLFLKLEKLKYIVTFKKIPSLSGFLCKKILLAECSWGTGLCFIYKRNMF